MFLNEAVNQITLYHGTTYENLYDILDQGFKGGRSHDIELPKIYLTPQIELAARYGMINDSFDEEPPVILEISISKNRRIKKLKHDPNDQHDDAWYDSEAFLNSNEIIELHRLEKQMSDILAEFSVDVSYGLFPDKIEQLDGINIFKLVRNILPKVVDFNQVKDKLNKTIMLRDFSYFDIMEDGTIKLKEQWYYSREQLYQADKLHFSTIKYFYVREADFPETNENLIVDRAAFGFKMFPQETREYLDGIIEILEIMISDEKDVFEELDETSIKDFIYFLTQFPAFDGLIDLVKSIWEAQNKDMVLRDNIEMLKKFYEYALNLYGEEVEQDPETVWIKIKNRFHMGMKPLKERYVVEGLSVTDNNRTFLENDSLDMPSARHRQLLLDVADSIMKVPPLRKSRIVRRLDFGVYGVVYLLDTDKVIKFYYEGNQKKDAEVHKKLEDALYSGEGGGSKLPVFDTGTIQGDEGRFTYTVMPKLVMLKEYYEMITGGNEEKYKQKIWAYMNLMSIIVTFLDLNQEEFGAGENSAQKIYQHIQGHPRRGFIESIVGYLGKEDTEAIVEMVSSAVEFYGPENLDIVKHDNVGVLATSIGTGQLTFIAFDV
jgi:hypothetical protein